MQNLKGLNRTEVNNCQCHQMCSLSRALALGRILIALGKIFFKTICHGLVAVKQKSMQDKYIIGNGAQIQIMLFSTAIFGGWVIFREVNLSYCICVKCERFTYAALPLSPATILAVFPSNRLF